MLKWCKIIKKPKSKKDNKIRLPKNAGGMVASVNGLHLYKDDYRLSPKKRLLTLNNIRRGDIISVLYCYNE